MSKTYIPLPLRRSVFDRAQGYCEYCLIPEALVLATHQVDHVIAEKHRGATNLENLALSCALCNQAKGSDIASIDEYTGAVEKLYNPRQEKWSEHFKMDMSSGEIVPLTSVGRVTIWLLQINRSQYLPERRLLMKSGIYDFILS